MPSQHQPSNRLQRECYPTLADRFGEDPARFLDTALASGARQRMVRQRIAGIDDRELLRAWEAVERNLGRGPDGGPRPDVLGWLSDRADALEAIGERPDRLTHGPRQLLAVEKPEPTFLDEDGESYRRNSVHRRSKRAWTETEPSAPVATDGGDSNA